MKNYCSNYGSSSLKIINSLILVFVSLWCLGLVVFMYANVCNYFNMQFRFEYIFFFLVFPLIKNKSFMRGIIKIKEIYDKIKNSHFFLVNYF